VNTIVGSLVDIDLQQLTVLSDNGNEIIFPIENVELDFRGGFRVGNLVSVQYMGEKLYADNRDTDVVVLRAADSADVQELSEPESETESRKETEGKSESETGTEQESQRESETGTESETESEAETESKTSEPESESAAEDDAGKIKNTKGKIKSIDRNNMTITITGSNKEWTFGIMNTRMYFAKGMKKGRNIVVSYTGDISDSEQNIISVIDFPSFEEMADAKEAAEQAESETASETEAESVTEKESGTEKETEKESETEKEPESKKESETKKETERKAGE